MDKHAIVCYFPLLVRGISYRAIAQIPYSTIESGRFADQSRYVARRRDVEIRSSTDGRIGRLRRAILVYPAIGRAPDRSLHFKQTQYYILARLAEFFSIGGCAGGHAEM